VTKLMSLRVFALILGLTACGYGNILVDSGHAFDGTGYGMIAILLMAMAMSGLPRGDCSDG